MLSIESRFDAVALVCGTLSLIGSGVVVYGVRNADSSTVVAGSALVTSAAAALTIGSARLNTG